MALSRMFLLKSVQKRIFCGQRQISNIASKRRIVLLGAPGAGKGTYASRLGPFLGIPHISSGDLIRDEINEGSDVGKEVKSIVESGGLISDELLGRLLQRRFAKPDAQAGYILDGTPRREEQIEVLDGVADIDLVMEIAIREDILLQKALARRVCTGCGKNYNLADIDEPGIRMPPLAPKVEGKCDECGGELIQRSDDTHEIVSKRIQHYKDTCEPIMDAYKKRGLFTSFELTAGVVEMWPVMQEMFTEK